MVWGAGPRPSARIGMTAKKYCIIIVNSNNLCFRHYIKTDNIEEEIENIHLSTYIDILNKLGNISATVLVPDIIDMHWKLL